MADMRNPAAAGRGVSIGVCSGKKNALTLPTATLNRKASPREALLDACWHTSLVHAATTAALLTHLIGHLRQHPDHVDRTVDRLVALRDRQPSAASLHVGRTEIAAAIDWIVASTIPNDFTASRLQGWDETPHARGKTEKSNE
jgi:hypothetical protein